VALNEISLLKLGENGPPKGQLELGGITVTCIVDWEETARSSFHTFIAMRETSNSSFIHSIAIADGVGLKEHSGFSVNSVSWATYVFLYCSVYPSKVL
jgi:hypothetical protein